jgi:hypothetical protein
MKDSESLCEHERCNDREREGDLCVSRKGLVRRGEQADGLVARGAAVRLMRLFPAEDVKT